MRNWEVTVPVGLYIAFVLITLGWTVWREDQGAKMCSPYKLERSHLSEGDPWVSCTDGYRVWTVRKHREFR